MTTVDLLALVATAVICGALTITLVSAAVGTPYQGTRRRHRHHPRHAASRPRWGGVHRCGARRPVLTLI